MSGFRNYTTKAPTLQRYLRSSAAVRAIMGPVGSGKTGACLIDPVYRAMRQAPHPREYELLGGQRLYLRKVKHAVIRSTQRDLERTTIPSWLYWCPKEMGRWTGGSGGVPATHTLLWDLGDGTAVQLVKEFVGLGEKKPDEALPGWEGTSGYMNEADGLPEAVLTYLRSRVGRYPAREAAIGFDGASWAGISLDFNGVDDQHWLYEKFVEHRPEGWEFFRQPAALLRAGNGFTLNPAAENLENLRPGYYEGQVAGQPAWFIRAKLLNEWAGLRDGDPVYTEWDEPFHLFPGDLPAIPGLPLVLGGDAGLHPAIVIGQQDHFGQLRALEEIVAPDSGMGAEAFGQLVNAVLRQRYPGFRVECCWYDPAGNQRSATDERSWAMVMQAVTGISFRACETNLPETRQLAVRSALLLPLVIDGKRAPGLLVSNRCRKLVRGFNGAYRLKRTKDAAGRILPEAEKNHPYSDVHDGLQYLAVGLGLHRQVVDRYRHEARAPRQIRAEDDGVRAEYERGNRRGIGGNGGPALTPSDWRREAPRQEYADDT